MKCVDQTPTPQAKAQAAVHRCRRQPWLRSARCKRSIVAALPARQTIAATATRRQSWRSLMHEITENMAVSRLGSSLASSR
ncbi:hypothetical protein ABIA27_004101 [Sinorhizobium fredii]